MRTGRAWADLEELEYGGLDGGHGFLAVFSVQVGQKVVTFRIRQNSDKEKKYSLRLDASFAFTYELEQYPFSKHPGARRDINIMKGVFSMQRIQWMWIVLVIGLLGSVPQGIAGPPAPDCCSPDYDRTVTQSYRKLMVKSAVYQSLPGKGQGIRLGIYQAQGDCGPGATAKNMDRLERAAETAKKYGIQLLVFPELYVPGYTLDPAAAKKVAEFADGESIARARKVAARLSMALVVPYAEKAEVKGKLLYFDSIALIDETGKLVTSYRKTHLYGQQERDNWSFGSKPPPVFRPFGFPVGVLNCYENEFPELVRLLALKGAKLIVGPTAADCYYTLPNGTRSAVPYPDVSTMLFPANAYANNVFFAYANRCGYERRGGNDWHYRGNSIVIGPHGDIKVAADHQQDTLLVADCVPAYYGMTHPAPKYNYLRDRRPEMYAPLTAPQADIQPGGWTYPTYENGREVGRE